MTAKFPRDEQYFQLHLSGYLQAVAAALFTGTFSKDHFRIVVENVTPLADAEIAEIAVYFKVRAPDINAPSDVASIPATAAPVLAKMTVSALNAEFTALGLATALDVTGADICGIVATSTTSTTPEPTPTPPPPPPPPPDFEA